MHILLHTSFLMSCILIEYEWWIWICFIFCFDRSLWDITVNHKAHLNVLFDSISNPETHPIMHDKSLYPASKPVLHDCGICFTPSSCTHSVVLLFHAYPLDTTILSGFAGINGHSLLSALLLSSLTTPPLPQTQFSIWMTDPTSWFVADSSTNRRQCVMRSWILQRPQWGTAALCHAL